MVLRRSTPAAHRVLHRLASPAADTLVEVDIERPGSLVAAPDQALLGRGLVKAVDAGSTIT
jgi:hypothetical protein